MRRLAAIAVIGVALVACARDEPAIIGTPEPAPTTPTESPTPTGLEGASCEDREGGTDNYVPNFVDVELESEGGIDRVTFVFEAREDQPPSEEPPRYRTGFVDQLFTDPQGEPADVEGEAFVSVSLMAFGVDLSGEEPVIIYTGPQEFTPGFPTVVEVEELGDFEALVTWGIGLSERACYRLTATPTELTLEFPSSEQA